MRDDCINIVFSVTDSYAEHLGVAVYSLLENNKSSFSIYVLSSDFSELSKKTIEKVVAYHPGSKITFIKPKSDIFTDLPLTISHITKETYFRYCLGSLLPHCDKAIYMDVDLLILGDISSFWSVDIEGFYVAGSVDLFIKDEASEFYDRTKHNSYKESIGLTESDIYVNAGVLLLNLEKIRKDDKEAELFSKTKELSGFIKFQDQDIINLVFKDGIQPIDCIYNYTERDALEKLRSPQEVRVVHFNGPIKPWAISYKSYAFMKYFADRYMECEFEYRKFIKGSDEPERKIKYALFSYETDNIGDEIQSIAARRFLPRIDHYVDRDHINKLETKDEVVKLIMNGWYTHNPDGFPPNNTDIKPLLISMYVADHVKDGFATDHNKFYLNKHGPVGARNTDTHDYFSSIGVDSYFSGCLTLTLKKSATIKKRDFILAVDLPGEVVDILKSNSAMPVLSMGAFITTKNMSREQRFALAEYYLYLYQSAHCVITTRLHATLPCLALETPVLNLEKENFESSRFAGLRELSHHMTISHFLENPDTYDINNPPENPKDYLKIRSKLEEKCSKYTGYINDSGFLTCDIEDLLHNVSLLQPMMDGLMSSYKFDYIGKLLNDRIDMANNSIEEVEAIRSMQQELAALKRERDDIFASKSWKIAQRLGKIKKMLI